MWRLYDSGRWWKEVPNRGMKRGDGIWAQARIEISHSEKCYQLYIMFWSGCRKTGGLQEFGNMKSKTHVLASVTSWKHLLGLYIASQYELRGRAGWCLLLERHQSYRIQIPPLRLHLSGNISSLQFQSHEGLGLQCKNIGERAIFQPITLELLPSHFIESKLYKDKVWKEKGNTE